MGPRLIFNFCLLYSPFNPLALSYHLSRSWYLPKSGISMSKDKYLYGLLTTAEPPPQRLYHIQFPTAVTESACFPTVVHLSFPKTFKVDYSISLGSFSLRFYCLWVRWSIFYMVKNHMHFFSLSLSRFFP